MKIITPPTELKRGQECIKFRQFLHQLQTEYPNRREDNHLDLTEVQFADSFGFRLLFDYRSIFSKITPPINEWVNMNYDIWVDSKKGLRKG